MSAIPGFSPLSPIQFPDDTTDILPDAEYQQQEGSDIREEYSLPWVEHFNRDMVAKSPDGFGLLQHEGASNGGIYYPLPVRQTSTSTAQEAGISPDQRIYTNLTPDCGPIYESIEDNDKENHYPSVPSHRSESHPHTPGRGSRPSRPRDSTPAAASTLLQPNDTFRIYLDTTGPALLEFYGRARPRPQD